MSKVKTTTPLFEELDLGGLYLTNRIVLAPLTRARSGPDRVPGPHMATYYAQRASAGLLITEATLVSPKGIGWAETPGIYNDAQVHGWSQVTERVHQSGTPIFLQLWHTGRASHSDFFNGDLPVAPSAVRLNGASIHTPFGKKEYETPRALTIQEIEATVGDYVKAAERAKAAGFDGVEIHAANGYLIDQFLQSKTNKRNDRYGGSVQRRYQFLKETVEGILNVFPPGRIGVRLSPNGVFHDMGSPDFRETFSYAISQLDGYGLGYLHVMDGLGFGFHELGEPFTLAQVRELYTGLLMGNCGYDKASAEDRISSGEADLIAFGRPYISNPDLVERFRNDWPLNPQADMKHWYSPSEEGYIDFPFYRPT